MKVAKTIAQQLYETVKATITESYNFCTSHVWNSKLNFNLGNSQHFDDI